MFHVPEPHRLLDGPMGSTAAYGANGAFAFAAPCIAGRDLWVIASDGLGWEHVSVHAGNRANKLFVPSWAEMCFIKSRFWDDEDVVMQLHPAKSQYVNMHPTTLHLWRPLGGGIPTPPPILVGFTRVEVSSRDAFRDEEVSHGS